jgi:hypothetical protein
MMARHNIRFVSLIPKKISGFRQHVKDDLGQKNRDVYNIPYNCFMKEHHWHITSHGQISQQWQNIASMWSTVFNSRTPRFSPLPCYMNQNISKMTPDTVTRRMAWY